MNDIARERASLYRDMAPRHLTPLWEVLHRLVPPRPEPACLPHQWKYADVRPFVERSGEVITAEEAVRRVLIFENPGLPGQSRVTGSPRRCFRRFSPGWCCSRPLP